MKAVSVLNSSDSLDDSELCANKTLWRAIRHYVRNLYMTKQQIAFELLVSGEIPASGESFLLVSQSNES